MLKLAYLQHDIQKILRGNLSVSELLLSYQLNLRSFRWLIKFWPILNSCINRLLVLLNTFLLYDWLRAVVFYLNLKYLHVKITNLFQVVV